MKDQAKKPNKPYPDFPLFPHPCGKWAKKIKGKTCYFGHWDNPQGALQEFYSRNHDTAPVQPEMRSEPDDDATPRFEDDGLLRLQEACDLFLSAKFQKCQSLEITQVTYKEYVKTCERILRFWDSRRVVESLKPSDFLAYKTDRLKTCNVQTVGNEITRVKTLLKWLWDSELTIKIAVGPDFRKPSRKVIRRLRRIEGTKLFTADQIHALLAESGSVLRAQIFLGINCAFGNTDCQSMPQSVIDNAIKAEWIDYARVKTEVDRWCPLWPETIAALKEATSVRDAVLARTNSRFGEFAFLLANGNRLGLDSVRITERFAAARKNAFIQRGGFYWLRHTFATIAGATTDQVAVNSIMGHVDATMAANYRHHISNERLLAVTNKVRDWLFE
ncbi:tyrosine-type recombinase/integrase [Neorhodopirellula pilleata]|uniref:Tyrosine recombinase XerC n=1 Tax=Neorhodopirellula pilleata TaxID=2714738 RepID=A0A5C6A8W6_9BACT|nr:site-specific integrase [Neorhodopirellula pilleata]TWT95775.1 Tyrosine recombinase XerC [Neorhodopirellula pilleata]